MSKLHEHNLELYNQVQNYIHNQKSENAIALVEWCQREGGKITGYYPTTYVSQEDVESAVNDDDFKQLTHDQMKDIASAVGEADVEYGTYWDTIRHYYYDVLDGNTK